MKRPARRTDRRRSRRAGLGVVIALVVVVLLQLSASADIGLPQLPLPTSTPLLEGLLEGDLPVSGSLEGATDLVDGTTDQLGGLLGTTTNPGTVPKRPAVKRPTVGTPATVSSPAGNDSPANGPQVRVSGRRVPSYGAAVTDGFSRTARRAAELAGPIAAPMALAMFAVALLLVAARGPGRLVKVEEERKTFRERRSFRL